MTPPGQGRRALALGVVVLILAGACGDDDGAPAADDPAAVVEAYRVAYNAHDVDAVMALFTEDSVVTGSPYAAESSGLAEIRAPVAKGIGDAADDEALTISNVEVAGDTVSWDDVWIRNSGQDYCGNGHRAVITDGKIVTWTWPADITRCP